MPLPEPGAPAIAAKAQNPAPAAGALLVSALQQSRVQAIIAELKPIDERVRLNQAAPDDLDRAIDLIHDLKQFLTADAIRYELLRDQSETPFPKLADALMPPPAA